MAFFHCSATTQHRPSFPTRRSSDLARHTVGRRRPPRQRCSVRLRPGRRCGSGGGGQDRTAFPAGDRSEEHTSELQSRRDLVCRLLLEKKKKNKKKTLVHQEFVAWGE